MGRPVVGGFVRLVGSQRSPPFYLGTFFRCSPTGVFETDAKLSDLIGRQVDCEAVAISATVAARGIVRAVDAGAECRSAAQIGKVGSKRRKRVNHPRTRRSLQPVDCRDEVTQRVALQQDAAPIRDLKPDTSAVPFRSAPRQ